MEKAYYGRPSPPKIHEIEMNRVNKPIPCFKAMTRFRTYGWKQYRNVFYKLTFSIADGQYLTDMASKNKTDLLISCDYFADPKLLISQQNDYSITYNPSR